MFCRNCGKEIQDNKNFCGYCGYNFNENRSKQIKVFFHRKKSFVGCVYPIDIYIDKKLIGSVNNNDSFQTEITYGNHSLLFSMGGGINESNVNFSEEYSTCYIEVAPAMGLVTPNVKILNIRFE